MECVTAGNLFVHLFFQTEPKYQLSNKKLQYLLCIAQFASISAGRTLYSDNIRNLKNSFVLEVIADTFMCNSLIHEGISYECKMNYTCSDFRLPYSRRKLYEIKENITAEDKELITTVFIHFGAFKETSLCKMLNEFVELRSVPLWAYVSPDDIAAFFQNAFSDETTIQTNLRNNKVFALCKELHNKTYALNNTESEQNTNLVASNTSVAPVTIPKPPVPKHNYLEPYLAKSLDKLTVGKLYCLYIETSTGKILKDVELISLKNNNRIRGKLLQIHPNLYSYSFEGVASDIKVVFKY